jgi:plasmid stabilization system protein ParE
VSSYRVEYGKLASTQIHALLQYLAEQASTKIASQYVDGLIAFCDSLDRLPHRFKCRDDIRPGLHLANYESHVVAYRVDDKAMRVDVLAIYHRRQNYEVYF